MRNPEEVLADVVKRSGGWGSADGSLSTAVARVQMLELEEAGWTITAKPEPPKAWRVRDVGGGWCVISDRQQFDLRISCGWTESGSAWVCDALNKAEEEG